MTNLNGFTSLLLAATFVSTLSAETHCPANVASIPFTLVNRHQVIVPVSINNAGPFSFLLDTGTQMTMIDPAMATALHIETIGKADVVSVGMLATASLAKAALVQAGPHSVENQTILVYDLANLQATGLNIRGVLGEDFLSRFDVLIDNGHRLLCLDDSATMRAEVKGSRTPLLAQATEDPSLASSLIVVARLSDGARPIRLKLDSGSAVNFLYNTAESMSLGMFRGASLQGGSNRSQKTFMAIPPQNVKIGSAEFSNIPFVTLIGAQKNSHTSHFDGLLSLGLFRRVFICHSDHFVVLDPL